MLKHVKSSEQWDQKSLGAKGFTLIELLVVIVILGILAAVVVFAVGGINKKGQEEACKTEARTVRTAQEAKYAQDGQYASASTLVSEKFLSNDPKLVTVATTGTPPSAFTLSWTGSICSSIASIGNP